MVKQTFATERAEKIVFRFAFISFAWALKHVPIMRYLSQFLVWVYLRNFLCSWVSSSFYTNCFPLELFNGNIIHSFSKTVKSQKKYSLRLEHIENWIIVYHSNPKRLFSMERKSWLRFGCYCNFNWLMSARTNNCIHSLGMTHLRNES